MIKLISNNDQNLYQCRNFIFVRHGQTSWGPADIAKGPLNLELNEVGRYQATNAYNLASANYPITNPIIYSSHLKRALETAHIFASYFGKDKPKPSIIQIEGLQERYYGDYRNVDRGIPYPSEQLCWERRIPLWLRGDVIKQELDLPADAESIEDFRCRIRETIQKIFNETYPLGPNHTLILVSHQKVFEFLAESLADKKLKLNQGGVCYFRFSNGKYVVEVIEPNVIEI